MTALGNATKAADLQALYALRWSDLERRPLLRDKARGYVPAQPIGIELAYARQMRALVRSFHGDIVRELYPVIDELAPPFVRHDVMSSNFALRFAKLSEKAKKIAESREVKSAMLATARKVAKHVEREQTKALGQPAKVNPNLDAFHQNRIRMREVLVNQLARAEDIIDKATRKGLDADAIKAQVKDSLGYSLAQAQSSASNQVRQAEAEYTQAAQQDAGVVDYVWRSRRDRRVRPDHRALDGTLQNWASPPRIEDGKHAHPGIAHGCRCVAVPAVGGVRKRAKAKMRRLERGG